MFGANSASFPQPSSPRRHTAETLSGLAQKGNPATMFSFGLRGMRPFGGSPPPPSHHNNEKPNVRSPVSTQAAMLPQAVTALTQIGSRLGGVLLGGSSVAVYNKVTSLAEPAPQTLETSSIPWVHAMETKEGMEEMLCPGMVRTQGTHAQGFCTCPTPVPNTVCASAPCRCCASTLWPSTW